LRERRLAGLLVVLSYYMRPAQAVVGDYFHDCADRAQ
jgi:hypothetical protein